MGLIKEPKNVEFYVIDKPWTEEERKEFSEFIRIRKQELKKRKQGTRTKEKAIKKGT